MYIYRDVWVIYLRLFTITTLEFLRIYSEVYDADVNKEIFLAQAAIITEKMLRYFKKT